MTKTKSNKPASPDKMSAKTDRQLPRIIRIADLAAPRKAQASRSGTPSLHRSLKPATSAQ
ncbi:hypothetical protein AAD018_009115 [Aestuariibius insulae]|uniref:hypothetical protein n=1 Tax=Aestuariibius insulae TaxID=2058287 RepID=UPI00345EB91A